MTLLERPEDLHPTPNILGSKAILGDGVKGSLLSKVEALDLAVVVLDHVQAPGGVAGLDVSRPPLLLAGGPGVAGRLEPLLARTPTAL